MSFNDIPGQTTAKRMLQNSLRRGKVSHAYIFSGPVGTGRKAMAFALAQAIYCKESEDDACGECLECRKVLHGNHPDIHLVEPDGATIKIDQIRTLQKEFAYKATASATKIYILVQAERMTTQAANSLLKFLEEPSSSVVAILITENGHALLPTIQSRAQWVSFTPMPRRDMMAALQQEGLPLTLIRPAVHLAAGLGAARELATASWFAEMRNVVLQLAKETYTRFPQAFMTIQQKLTKSELAEHLPTFYDLLTLWLKDMVQLCLLRREHLVYPDHSDWMEPLARTRDVREWIRLTGQAVELQKRLRSNANPQLLLERTMIAIQGGVICIR
ncbi:ATPase [Gordoniibacillus kamchatkensis]|uniref:ATPase n=1 Tax=Gordoniibacillus kamchatkensis TaxID=1590651 RepID=A0ABR5AEE8_9BACL|nr:DNA polymerase III subunit delta' [Paenibacillus sp. VKM B-2647]KIL39421.1 ATPase [Paenibacillus sp. VKM B-2647]